MRNILTSPILILLVLYTLNASIKTGNAMEEKTERGSIVQENNKVVKLTTARAVGQKITLGIKATGNIEITGLKGVYEDNKMVEFEILFPSFSIAGNVTSLICMGGEITSIDTSNMPALEVLLCGSNKLTSLDLRENKALLRLWCEDNDITDLKIGSQKLDNLACQKNKIKSLDLSGQSELLQLMVGDNLGLELTLPKGSKLMALDCSNSGLTTLDLSNCKDLQELSCANNKLVNLDLSANPALGILDCNHNDLQEIKLSNCPELTSIDCSFNKLESIDLSVSQKITELYCQENRIKKLDLSSNISIGSLACDNNELEDLIIGGNNLSAIWCYSNNLNDLIFQKVVDMLNARDVKRKGYIYVVDKKNAHESNICTPETVEKAVAKNWNVIDYDGGSNNGAGIPYEGEISSGVIL